MCLYALLLVTIDAADNSLLVTLDVADNSLLVTLDAADNSLLVTLYVADNDSQEAAPGLHFLDSFHNDWGTAPFQSVVPTD